MYKIYYQCITNNDNLFQWRNFSLPVRCPLIQSDSMR